MGSKVNALLQTIATNNVTEGADGKQIEVTSGGNYDGSTGKITSVAAKAKTGQSYKVEFTPNNTGIIISVKITGNN